MTASKFPKAVRLLKSAEFDRVMKRRQSAGDGMVVLYASANECGHPRLGLIVSRKCGNAVVRNRWKRCLREAFRMEQANLPRDLDIVVLPRRGAEPNLSRLRQSLTKLSGKLQQRLHSPTGSSRTRDSQ